MSGAADPRLQEQEYEAAIKQADSELGLAGSEDDKEVEKDTDAKAAESLETVTAEVEQPQESTGDRATEEDTVDFETAAAEGEQPQESTGDRATEEDSVDVEIPSTPTPDKAESDAGYGDDAVGEPMSTEGGQQTAATAEQQTPAGEVSTDGGTSEGSTNWSARHEITQQMHENEETDAETIATLTADTETLQENKFEAEEEQHKAEENMAELETGVAEAVEVSKQGEEVFTAKADEDEEQLQLVTDEDVSAEADAPSTEVFTAKANEGEDGTTRSEDNSYKAASAEPKMDQEAVREEVETIQRPEPVDPSFDAMDGALGDDTNVGLVDPQASDPMMSSLYQTLDAGLIQGCAVEPLGADPTAEIAEQDAEALAVDEAHDATIDVVDVFEAITPGG